MQVSKSVDNHRTNLPLLTHFGGQTLTDLVSEVVLLVNRGQLLRAGEPKLLRLDSVKLNGNIGRIHGFASLKNSFADVR
jgi:hypothetical protein